MPTLYSFGNAANVSSNNFTTLYNTGAGIVNPQMAYGNANVVGLLAVGTDGGNTIGNIVASGNINTSGNISASGNVYADYIVGSIIGNVAIPGNNTEVLFNAAGGIGTDSTFTFNTVTNTLGVDVISASGNITATGNVTASYFFGNIIGNIVGNLVAPGANTEVLFNSNGNVAASPNFTFNGTVASIAGNVSASYFLGNGSQLTGIISSYGNANVVSLLSNFGSNTISTTGNITGGVFAGNGSELTNITGANVTGTVGLAQYVTGNAQGNITTVGTLTSLTASGNISTTGNITGNYFLGNGSQLTGLPEIYGNANVVSLLASFGSNTISTTGNITGGVFAGNGSGLTNLAGANVTGTVDLAQYVTANAQANITSVGILTGLDATGNISTTGNITGNYILGNGSQLTGLPDSYSNAQVASYLSSGNLTSNIITTANVQGGNLIGAVWTNSITGIVAAGNIDISPDGAGHVNLNADVVRIGDNNTDAVLATRGSGNLTIKPHEGDANQSLINIVNGVNGNIELTLNGTGNVNTARISASGNITADYYFGNGSQLTGIISSYGNANVAANLAAFGSNPISTTGNITAGYFIGDGSLLTNITAGNIVGTVANATYALTSNAATFAGTVTTAAQPNITSVGTLTSLTASGNISTTGNISGNYYIGNGSLLTGITAVSSYGNSNVATYLASGTNTSNIITTGNVTGGNLITSGAGGNIVGANVISATTITTTGNITGLYFFGNGSQLTGIAAGYSNSNVSTYLASGTNTGNIITTGNVTGGNLTTGGLITATGNVTGGNLITGGVITATGNITAVANIAGGNILTVGLISATGNITSAGNVTAGFFLGNGSQLTGLPATYGNANVAANLAAFGSNPISSTGNITTTANISGSYFLGNGSQLTGISASLPANVTANVFTSQVYSYGNATGTITPDISLGSIQTMTLTGNITLNALSNVASGQSATFIMTQDATGNRLITSTWKFASNVRTLSTAANAVDMISVTYIGSTYYASLIRGFA